MTMSDLDESVSEINIFQALTFLQQIYAKNSTLMTVLNRNFHFSKLLLSLLSTGSPRIQRIVLVMLRDVFSQNPNILTLSEKSDFVNRIFDRIGQSVAVRTRIGDLYAEEKNVVEKNRVEARREEGRRRRLLRKHRKQTKRRRRRKWKMRRRMKKRLLKRKKMYHHLGIVLFVHLQTNHLQLSVRCVEPPNKPIVECTGYVRDVRYVMKEQHRVVFSVQHLDRNLLRVRQPQPHQMNQLRFKPHNQLRLNSTTTSATFDDDDFKCYRGVERNSGC